VNSMAFYQTNISNVSVALNGTELDVAWKAIGGNYFQVYIDRRLAWSGMQQFCSIPIPGDAAGRNIWIEVGTVTNGDMTQDYSASLSGVVGSGDRARLTWYGGSYLDPSGNDDVQGYQIHTSKVSGEAVDYNGQICSVPAYPSRILTDGYGMGEFGRGGFGRAASYYEWRSGPLSSGSYEFAVIPYDRAGNSQDSPRSATVTVETAPLPPRDDENESRLTYSYSGRVARIATIQWLASRDA
jgi:hypothetical protein